MGQRVLKRHGGRGGSLWALHRDMGWGQNHWGGVQQTGGGTHISVTPLFPPSRGGGGVGPLEGAMEEQESRREVVTHGTHIDITPGPTPLPPRPMGPYGSVQTGLGRVPGGAHVCPKVRVSWCWPHRDV